MYKLLFLCLLLVGSFSTQADVVQYSITVPAGTSTVIVPPRAMSDIGSFTNWVAEASIAQGTIVYIANDFPVKDQYYMALEAGTLGTVVPTNTIGQLETNGTALLIHCYFTDGRTEVLVTQQEDAAIWYWVGYVASTNGGEFSYIKGQQYNAYSDEARSVYSDAIIKLNIVDKE